ncbi:unnamed protein product, partial [Effrenium voratum]
AVFQEKCREFKLPADSMQALQDQGINTLGSFGNCLVQVPHKMCLLVSWPLCMVEEPGAEAGVKVTKEITIDAHQRLQVKDGKSKVTCETHSELLLTQALLRRALALDLTGVVSFAVMESYNSGVRRLDDGTLPLDAQFPSLQ